MIDSVVSIGQPATWATAIRYPATEFSPTRLPIVSGAVPAGLRGTLYRNGPARLQRGQQRVGHWFDGDGAVLGVRFTDSAAIGVYRYVQTNGYQAEAQAGRYLFPNYGMVTPGGWWQRFGRPIKNAANTSVIALPDRLLALWEGGEPHALTLDTLETIGLDNLGTLAGKPYSAHPKRDAKTGEIFNFGVTLGAKVQLQVYRSDASGQIRQTKAIPLSGIPLIHDFVLAGRYLIFCIPPVRIQPLPVLLQWRSYSEAMQWQPSLGTEVIVLDRDTLDVVSQLEADPWFQWHFGNGYELSDGSVILDIARYPDFQTNQRLREVATGQIETLAPSTLWQLRLNVQSSQVLTLQQILPRSCEFPVVNPQELGQPCRYTYLSMHPESADQQRELYGTIARFDHQTGTLTEATLGEHHYPTEPIYAPDATQSEQSWILTVVYDGDRQCSELWIYAADRLADAPVCRLSLPEVVPPGFHGTWHPAPA
ncbi:carotenoid oxygenase family protein [Pantanalinema rosaneae CENA516]|uniref:carotenoid oxygenase family protein n=1 Tax=Pantanalinema rosaneae TaxID=1620701 RepID=UPI003D6E0355